MLFTDQRFCITPPYRTARPGRLISPTKVAAVICHALSPGLSQLGYGNQVMCLLLSRYCPARTRPTRDVAKRPRHMKARRQKDAVGPPWPDLRPGFRHLSRRRLLGPSGEATGRAGRPAPAGARASCSWPGEAQTLLASAPQACRRRRRACSRTSTVMQSLRAGEPPERANAPSPTAASTTHASRIATIVFSRRPQCSGWDSRRDWSCMIIAVERYSGWVRRARRPSARAPARRRAPAS